MEAAPQLLPVEPPPPPRRTSAGPIDVLWAVLAIVALNVVGMVPLVIRGLVNPKQDDLSLVWFPVDTVITLAVAWYFGCRRYGRSLREAFSYWPVRVWLVALGAVLGLACAATVMLVPHGAARPPMFKMVSALLQRPAGGILMLAIAALAALMEETYYRGFIYTALSQAWGRARASVVVALWFTVLHVPQLAGDWTGLGAVAVMGVIVTLLRAFTGSTLPGLATHLVYNLTLTAPGALSSLARQLPPAH
jgi:membrane protease YdiL (CAAX protease family)